MSATKKKAPFIHSRPLHKEGRWHFYLSSLSILECNSASSALFFFFLLGKYLVKKSPAGVVFEQNSHKTTPGMTILYMSSHLSLSRELSA